MVINQKRVAGFVVLGSLVLTLIFFSFNITGSAVGNLTGENFRVFGIVFFGLFLISVFAYFKDSKSDKTRKRDKKAVSPVIATVLLIVMVIVLSAIIFLWARGFVSEQVEKFGEPVERVCEDAAFDFELIKNIGAGDSLAYDIEIVNRGNVPIYSFEIKQINEGNSVVKSFDFSEDIDAFLDIGESLEGSVPVESDTKEIIIYPQILGSVKGKNTNQPFTCINYGKVRKL